MVQQDFDHQAGFIPPDADIPLNMMLRWTGHQRTSRNYFLDGMKRGRQEYVLWQYTISGCGLVECEEGTLPVPPGNAFLLTVPDKHRYLLPESSDHWEFLYLGFYGSEALRIARDLRKKHSPVSVRFACPAALETATYLLNRNMEKKFTAPAEVSGLVYRFFMDIINGSYSGTENCDKGKSANLISLIHQYCLKHLSEPVSIEDLADFTGYSRSHFCRIFSRIAGKSPHAYLLELRIRMALRMLQSNNISVKEAAAACGFADTSYFCKVFRRFYKTSPTSFLNL